jgi:TetR/AcrR family transcriptional regulator, transcriptional repressor for nem operon
MTKLARDKRQRLIESAARLARERGLAKTSLADIAKASGVPLGNVYYYFKTRDEIVHEVLRFAKARSAKMLVELDALSTPRQRLVGFMNSRSAERDLIAKFGSQDGGLVMQVQFENKALAKAAEELFAQQLLWLARQFRFLGQGNASRSCALHVLSSFQGVALLAQSLNDPSLVKQEVSRLRQWIVSL